jgi:acetyltransferase-like isoleucine patch superfamily enzyme
VEKIVKAYFSSLEVRHDPEHELLFATYLSDNYTIEERLLIFDRFKYGETNFDYLMRRIVARSVLKKTGNDMRISSGISFIHPESIEVGDGVFIGQQTIIQGRKDGVCKIGNKVWIGPQSYFDARNLIIEDNVGWGPGAKVLGSQHSGIPVGDAVISTDLIIKPVVIRKNCDIGVNVTILPGVTIGEGSIIGAGAVVTTDIESYAIAAGIPAKIIRKRE